jgi:hypothetical protein
MKKILVFFTFSLLLLLTGCSHVEDLNGPDNFELATYTFDDIKNNRIKSTNSLFSVQSGFINSGSIKIKKFSGHKLLVSKYVNPQDQVKITSTVESGNLAIYIKCDDDYYKIPINTEYTFTFENFSGKSLIYFIGESAKLRIEYKYIT